MVVSGASACKPDRTLPAGITEDACIGNGAGVSNRNQLRRPLPVLLIVSVRVTNWSGYCVEDRLAGLAATWGSSTVSVTGTRTCGSVLSGLSSEEIADITALSRGTVVYHINKLIEAGLVREQSKKYYLEAENLEKLIAKLRVDMDQAFDTLSDIGKEIDTKLKY